MKIGFAGFAGLSLLFFPLAAAAHGTMEVPISRVYACYKEGPESPKSAACKAVVQAGGTQPLYDWNEVNQGQANGDHARLVRDGAICAGGRSKYAGLDLPGQDWPATTIVPDASGRFPFVFHATAVHAARYVDFYITRDGWNPAAPLKWADLARFASVSSPKAVDHRFRMNVQLPAGKTGRHVIFAIWQRSDSPEAFYSCSDVRIAAIGGATPPVSWDEAGQVVARADLPAGSTATLRVFDAAGRDVARHAVTLSAATGKAAKWPATLAKAVNDASSIFRIGVLGTSGANVTVTPVASATANRVYRSSRHPGHGYEIDIDTPATGGGGTGGSGTWQEGTSYRVGQAVTHQGRTYRCLQAHTAYVGAGWTPSTTPALWQPAG
ncbi:lytic polysaccharide monooxygenase [Geminicoccus roseus]|uniref:lytic polysaccharide monooxygenase n=1 Tax=Geminicoccus roseus TaxID=404900 RepID=UPI000407F3B2|nr:lytic polysaccharide monooxygenase [Geminicoccus roseus]